jgi:hypothetical protein
MHRIALNRNIPDLLEDVDPLDDLLEYVPEYNSLSALASVLPSPPNAFLLRLFGECVQVCKCFKRGCATKVYATPFVVVQLRYCECPKVVTARNTKLANAASDRRLYTYVLLRGTAGRAIMEMH